MGNDEDGSGREGFLNGKEIRMRTFQKAFLCDDEVGKEDASVITAETWLTGKEGDVKEEKNRRGLGEEILLRDGTLTVGVFDSCVVCRELALENMAVVCLGENMGMFADACVTEVESSEAAAVIDDVLGKPDFEFC